MKREKRESHLARQLLDEDGLTTEQVLAELSREISSRISQIPHCYRISSSVLENLRTGRRVYNEEFDRIFPLDLRIISSIQWSPIEVAKCIAEFLRERGSLRFMDLGSGVGKLCTLLGILSDMEVTGIEQRRNLVKVSRRIALENSLKNVKFLHGDMMEIDWEDYDVFYLYNPFQEHRYKAHYARIDNAVEYDLKMFQHFVREAKRHFRALSPGKIVITYHGFGGEMPKCMRMMQSNPLEEGGHLSFFEKTSEPKTRDGKGN